MNAITQFALTAALSIAAFLYGLDVGDGRCELRHAKAQQREQQARAKETARALDRSVQQGQRAERKRAAIDHHFTRLEQEAAHDTPDPVDACVLPAERLRRWAAANAGAEGAPASEPDRAASGAAAPAVGRDARPGGQPPASGAVLPPGGSALLRPAGLAGDHAR